MSAEKKTEGPVCLWKFHNLPTQAFVAAVDHILTIEKEYKLQPFPHNLEHIKTTQCVAFIIPDLSHANKVAKAFMSHVIFTPSRPDKIITSILIHSNLTKVLETLKCKAEDLDHIILIPSIYHNDGLRAMNTLGYAVISHSPTTPCIKNELVLAKDNSSPYFNFVCVSADNKKMEHIHGEIIKAHTRTKNLWGGFAGPAKQDTKTRDWRTFNTQNKRSDQVDFLVWFIYGIPTKKDKYSLGIDYALHKLENMNDQYIKTVIVTTSPTLLVRDYKIDIKIGEPHILIFPAQEMYIPKGFVKEILGRELTPLELDGYIIVNRSNLLL